MLESVYQNYYMYPEASNNAPTFDAAPPPPSLASITPQPPSSQEQQQQQQQQLPSPTSSIILGAGGNNISSTSPWSSSSNMAVSCGGGGSGSSNNNNNNNNNKGHTALMSGDATTLQQHASTGKIKSASRSSSCRFALRHNRLTTTTWEEEKTACYMVDAKGICVTRRADNNMVNGTKLLNVVGISRGKRDGILKNAKGRIVVKVGPMSLKGVWIPLAHAEQLAAKFRIEQALYPLLEQDPSQFLGTAVASHQHEAMMASPPMHEKATGHSSSSSCMYTDYQMKPPFSRTINSTTTTTTTSMKAAAAFVMPPPPLKLNHGTLTHNDTTQQQQQQQQSTAPTTTSATSLLLPPPATMSYYHHCSSRDEFPPAQLSK